MNVDYRILYNEKTQEVIVARYGFYNDPNNSFVIWIEGPVSWNIFTRFIKNPSDYVFNRHSWEYSKGRTNFLDNWECSPINDMGYYRDENKIAKILRDPEYKLTICFHCKEQIISKTTINENVGSNSTTIFWYHIEELEGKRRWYCKNRSTPARPEGLSNKELVEIFN